MGEFQDKTNVQFGKNLARLRKAMGLTQKTFAKKAGLSRIYISKLEVGKRGVSIITAKQIAKALKCRRNVLLKGVWE